MLKYEFNLETAIATWRQLLGLNRSFLTEDIRELENHLRDHIEELMANGLDTESAFRAATDQLGSFSDFEPEFYKVKYGKTKRKQTIKQDVCWNLSMIQNYFLAGTRNIMRHPGYTSINLFGLALGIACCIVIGLFVHQELSYDNWHEKGDRIYRVTNQRSQDRGTQFSARSPVPLGLGLVEEYPEVEMSVRFWRNFQSTLGGPQATFRERGLYFVDPSVFDIFSLEMKLGDPSKALSEPGTIVLTEASATRFFGDEDPIGKVLDYNGFPGNDSLRFIVTGILRDLPQNTHLSFTALASLVGIKSEEGNYGSAKPIWTYVLLKEGTDPSTLEAKLPGFVGRHFQFEERSRTMHLEPLSGIHLSSLYDGGFKPKSNMMYTSLLGAIGLFILILACVNFVNLSTVRATTRAREVGMRKVFGAVRGQLIGQFLGESLLMVFTASLMAIGVVALFLDKINADFQMTLSMNDASAGIWILLGALVLGVGFLTGLYPTLVLLSMKPVDALAKRLSAGGSAILRKSLIVFQFGVSFALIASTLLVYHQLDFLQNADLGFDKEMILVMPRTQNEDAMRASLAKNPNVLNVSVSQRVPVSRLASDGRPVTPEGADSEIRVDSYIIDDQFIDTFGLRLLAGRNLSLERGSDADAFIINETALERFGWGTPEEAIGRRLSWHSAMGPVVGVVTDFHIDSMHERITPVVLQLKPGERWWRTFISAKISSANVPETLAFLKKTWELHNPESAYEAFFVDDSLTQLHSGDARIARIVSGFAGIAILIACLGLFGLAAYSAEQRVKEIGVRKVMGASMGQIIVLLTKDFVALVIVAILLSIPVVMFGMGAWLSKFAYRVELSPQIYIVAAAVTLVIAFATVSYQAVRASRFNPVKCLRQE